MHRLDVATADGQGQDLAAGNGLGLGLLVPATIAAPAPHAAPITCLCITLGSHAEFLRTCDYLRTREGLDSLDWMVHPQGLSWPAPHP